MNSPLTRLKLLSGYEFQAMYIEPRQCRYRLMQFLPNRSGLTNRPLKQTLFQQLQIKNIVNSFCFQKLN